MYNVDYALICRIYFMSVEIAHCCTSLDYLKVLNLVRVRVPGEEKGPIVTCVHFCTFETHACVLQSD